MSLRKATIRLAYERPELRAHLLPLLARTASPDEEAMTVTAGRPWGGKGYKSKAKDYDDASPGPGSPPCHPNSEAKPGEPECYAHTPMYKGWGNSNPGANGSTERREYNKKYREQVEGV
jgi:hypothetical protein